RYAETDSLNASPDKEIVVSEGVKQDQSAPTTPSGVAPTVINGNDGKIIGVTTDMEYRAEAEEHYTAITGTEVNGLTAGKYFVRYAETDSLNASPDKEVVILEGQKQDQEAPNSSELIVTHVNSDTNTSGKIEGVNNTMEYRKVGEEHYMPINGTSIENLQPGSYQIRYAATEVLHASEAITVNIFDEAKEDREAPQGDNLVITTPTTAGGNDGRIEHVTSDMEYRKVNGGSYIAVTGTSIDNLSAGSYEIRYAETETHNPSLAIVVVVPDGEKQEQNPPSDIEVKAVDVSVHGAADGKIIGVNTAMEYQKQGAGAGEWLAIVGVEVTGLEVGTYYVRYKETVTHYASDALTVVISDPI